MQLLSFNANIVYTNLLSSKCKLLLHVKVRNNYNKLLQLFLFGYYKIAPIFTQIRTILVLLFIAPILDRTRPILVQPNIALIQYWTSPLLVQSIIGPINYCSNLILDQSIIAPIQYRSNPILVQSIIGPILGVVLFNIGPSAFPVQYETGPVIYWTNLILARTGTEPVVSTDRESSDGSPYPSPPSNFPQ